jgi:hypothetical protein
MRKYRITSLLLLLVAAFLSMSQLAAAQTFNAASDFSPTANPNGAWSYGWSASRGTAFNVFPDAVNYCGYGFGLGSIYNYICPGQDMWTAYLNGNLEPVIVHNGTPYTFDAISCCNPTPPGGLLLHPGPGGENAVIRWTAPAKGLYKVTATFSGLDYGGPTTTDVAVLHNGTQIFSDNVSGFGYINARPFSSTVSVLAGDTIDFTLGYGTDGDYGADSTGLDAVITAESQVLSSDLTNLISGSNLSPFVKGRLKALVSAIETALASGHKAAAILELKVLVGEIEFLMWTTPPVVPAALGDQIITDANEAIARLSS